jgi:hypothetical protein
MQPPLLVLSVCIESVARPQGEILTDPGPIKLHESQEFFSLPRVIRIISHTEQCCFSLYETFPELLPV